MPRCEVLPLPDQQAAFLDAGREVFRWHFGRQYPRPFFYPLPGPLSGRSVTRMGHPGAPNHDHHRSVWIAHHKVAGVDFWADTSPARIEQRDWLAIAESDAEGVYSCQLGWRDGHDPADLLRTELVAAYRPDLPEGWGLELQMTHRPTAQQLELGETNFGFLGVRVARSLSGFFGAGTITDSRGQTGEMALFGKPSPWIDYSGPQRDQAGTGAVVEGVTVFDHPSNGGAPGHPVPWHIREDGWIGPSACRTGPVLVTQERPLILRYLLHVHAGPADQARAQTVFDAFANRPGFVVSKSKAPHRQFDVRRAE